MTAIQGCLVHLWQVTMRIHHCEEVLNVFELLLCRRLLVFVELSDLFITHFKQNLLWFLCLEHLCGPAVLNNFELEAVRRQFRLGNHRLTHHACFLVEGVLIELILEPKVLELLLLSAFSFHIGLGVEHT